MNKGDQDWGGTLIWLVPLIGFVIVMVVDIARLAKRIDDRRRNDGR